MTDLDKEGFYRHLTRLNWLDMADYALRMSEEVAIDDVTRKDLSDMLDQLNIMIESDAGIVNDYMGVSE